MFLSKLGSVAVVAGALATFALAPVSASASSIGFAGLWQESDSSANPGTNTLSFDSFTTLFADGIFTGYQATSVKALDFTATAFGNNGVSALTTYAISTGYDGTAWKTYTNRAGDVITFDLDLDATWLRTFDLADSDVNYEQAQNSAGVFEYTGTYTLADGSTLFGRGSLNASKEGAAALYEITQTAVPLPAAAWLMVAAIGALGAVGRRKKIAA